jgi:starch synthase
VVSVVTRLVHQKGIHLIKHAAWRTLERGGQFVLLGSAPDGRVQGEFNALKDQLSRQYPDRAALYFAYDEPLSHLIYAASDMFLVPSMFEPCGLTQMVAMRYGTVPVVRRTGGLNDTVFDVDHDDDRARSMGEANRQQCVCCVCCVLCSMCCG